MTGLVERVRNRLDTRCLVYGRLSKDGCKLSMAGAPEPRLIVDFDKPGSPLGPDVPRCDYLLIAHGIGSVGWVAPVELKRDSLHADEVVRQLQEGAYAAEKFISKKERIRFRPIAASSRTPKAERKKVEREEQQSPPAWTLGSSTIAVMRREAGQGT